MKSFLETIIGFKPLRRVTCKKCPTAAYRKEIARLVDDSMSEKYAVKITCKDCGTEYLYSDKQGTWSFRRGR